MTTSDDALQKILSVRGGTLGEFPDRNNPDDRVVRNRYLAVPMLREYWADRDNSYDLIMNKLGCSPRHIEIAEELEQKDPVFQAQLDEIRGLKRPPRELANSSDGSDTKPKPPGPKPKPPDPKPDPKPVVDVTRLLETAAWLGHTSVDELKSPEATHDLVKLRDVVLALLHKHFGLNQTDAAKILKRDADDVVRSMIRMRPPDLARADLLRQFCSELDINYAMFLSRLGKRRKDSG